MSFARTAIVVSLALTTFAPVSSAMAKDSHSNRYRCETSYVDGAGKLGRLGGDLIFGQQVYRSTKGRLLLDGATFAFDGYAPVRTISLPQTDNLEEHNNVALIFDGQVVTPVTSDWKNTDRATVKITFYNHSQPEAAKRLNWMAECKQVADDPVP